MLSPEVKKGAGRGLICANANAVTRQPPPPLNFCPRSASSQKEKKKTFSYLETPQLLHPPRNMAEQDGEHAAPDQSTPPAQHPAVQPAQHPLPPVLEVDVRETIAPHDHHPFSFRPLLLCRLLWTQKRAVEKKKRKTHPLALPYKSHLRPFAPPMVHSLTVSSKQEGESDSAIGDETSVHSRCRGQSAQDAQVF